MLPNRWFATPANPTAPLAPTLADYGVEIGCVIRAADKRAGGYVFEAFCTRNLTVSIEALRRNKLDHRKMLRGGPEILA